MRCGGVLLRASGLRRALEPVGEHLLPGGGIDRRLPRRRIIPVPVDHPRAEDSPRRRGEATGQRVPSVPEESNGAVLVDASAGVHDAEGDDDGAGRAVLSGHDGIVAAWISAGQAPF